MSLAAVRRVDSSVLIFLPRLGKDADTDADTETDVEAKADIIGVTAASVAASAVAAAPTVERPESSSVRVDADALVVDDWAPAKSGVVFESSSSLISIFCLFDLGWDCCCGRGVHVPSAAM